MNNETRSKIFICTKTKKRFRKRSTIWSFTTQTTLIDRTPQLK